MTSPLSIFMGVLAAAGATAVGVSILSSPPHPQNENASLEAKQRSTKREYPLAISEPSSRSGGPEKTKSRDRSQDHLKLQVQKTITVGGHVVEPGELPFKHPITLAEAIRRAGGATEFASLKRVALSRDGNQMLYDLTSENRQKVFLEAHDSIHVPQKHVMGR